MEGVEGVAGGRVCLDAHHVYAVRVCVCGCVVVVVGGGDDTCMPHNHMLCLGGVRDTYVPGAPAFGARVHASVCVCGCAQAGVCEPAMALRCGRSLHSTFRGCSSSGGTFHGVRRRPAAAGAGAGAGATPLGMLLHWACKLCKAGTCPITPPLPAPLGGGAHLEEPSIPNGRHGDVDVVLLGARNLLVNHE